MAGGHPWKNALELPFSGAILLRDQRVGNFSGIRLKVAGTNLILQGGNTCRANIGNLLRGCTEPLNFTVGARNAEGIFPGRRGNSRGVRTADGRRDRYFPRANPIGLPVVWKLNFGINFHCQSPLTI